MLVFGEVNLINDFPRVCWDMFVTKDRIGRFFSEAHLQQENDHSFISNGFWRLPFQLSETRECSMSKMTWRGCNMCIYCILYICIYHMSYIDYVYVIIHVNTAGC